MRIPIALDLGTKTGWALLMDGRIVSGTWTFAPGRFEGGGIRYLRFRQRLEELIEELTGGDVVMYFEEVRAHKGAAAAHAYGGFMATLTAYCEEHSIPYQGIPVGTIKKHATGKGNSNKQKMMAAAVQQWPDEDFVDDNEVDARWLLDYMLESKG